MNIQPVLNDNERFPLITDLEFLKNLRQDINAPRYNFKSGDRLTDESLKSVKQYSNKDLAFWDENNIPNWIDKYLSWCKETVPAYKDRPDGFKNQPSICREDIANTPWNFVSDECNIDDLLVYSTSGTTGAPMDVLFDATAQATWIPQMESILKREGISLEGGKGKVSICLICFQEETLTYASLSTYLKGAGVLKINLNPKDWNDPADRIKYLEQYNPEILTGDPFAFLELTKLKPNIKPKALVSSAMKLNTGVRKKLESQFKCFVLDIYSLTECRMIAYSNTENEHHLIRPELYIEILNPNNDTVMPLGVRGEITVSGGNNPFLPLIRYRTGDFGSLKKTESGFCIINLEGRNPTIFKTTSGQFINNVDISRAMKDFILSSFTLHQQKDGSLTFEGWGENLSKQNIEVSLKQLFGNTTPVTITLNREKYMNSKKVIYSSEFSEGDIK